MRTGTRGPAFSTNASGIIAVQISDGSRTPMHYLGALILIVLGGWLVQSPGFRKAVRAIPAILILILIVMIISHRASTRDPEITHETPFDTKQTQSETRLRPLINPANVVLSSVKFARRNDTTWEFNAIAFNASDYTLGGLHFEVTMTDCPAAEECVIIGKTHATAPSVDAPPHQARAFRSTLQFNNQPITARPLYWSYKLTGTEAAF
jgi:hypothetical protein